MKQAVERYKFYRSVESRITVLETVLAIKLRRYNRELNFTTHRFQNNSQKAGVSKSDYHRKLCSILNITRTD